jgi:hypothetical protein
MLGLLHPAVYQRSLKRAFRRRDVAATECAFNGGTPRERLTLDRVQPAQV